jgi:hypothetical protein
VSLNANKVRATVPIRRQIDPHAYCDRIVEHGWSNIRKILRACCREERRHHELSIVVHVIIIFVAPPSTAQTPFRPRLSLLPSQSAFVMIAENHAGGTQPMADEGHNP